jgi:hypothetical protein
MRLWSVAYASGPRVLRVREDAELPVPSWVFLLAVDGVSGVTTGRHPDLAVCPILR